jgi:hypothetical protein
MSNLLEASGKLRSWLLSPDAAFQQIYIPDDVWESFSEAVRDTRDEVDKEPEVLIMPDIEIPLMTEQCHECLRRRGGCQAAYGGDRCNEIRAVMFPKKE